MGKVKRRGLVLLLVTAVLFTSVNLDVFRSQAGVASPEELAESGWDYAFTAELGGDSVSYLDEAFDVYQYNKPVTAGDTAKVAGPVEPSAENAASNDGEGGYSYFTTQAYGSNSRGGLKPTSISGGNGSGYAALTYTKESMTDFEAEYEFYSSWGRVFGLAFGAEQGVFPLSLDNDNSNDTGVAIYMENNGTMFVYGAIDSANTSATTGVTVTKDVTNTQYYGNVVGTANVKAAGMTGDDTIEVENTLTADSKTFTMCVKVENGVLTIYEKNHADYVVTIPLSGNYQGGYVSLIANETNHGAFGDFSIKNTAEPEPEEGGFTVELGGGSVSYLDEDFDVYQYNKPTTAENMAKVTGPVEPSATDPNSYDGAYSYFTTQAYGNYSKGGLKPTFIPGGNGSGYTVLTYTKESMTDFEAEYEFYSSWGRVFGLAFGAEQGVFPLSLDNDNSNDTGVAIYMENNGTMYVYGAIDSTNAAATAGVTVTKNVTNTQYYGNVVGTANVKAEGMTGDDTIEVEDTLTADSKTFTMCVKVQDGILTIYEKDHADRVVTVPLAENYQGGYVSLVANATDHGAFGDFSIKNTAEAEPEPEPEEDGFTVELGGGSVSYLDEDFDVYQYNKPVTAGDTAKVAGPVEPSEENAVSNDGKGGYSYFTTQPYGNNSRGGLKPTSIPGGNGSGYTVLTYTKESMTDFEAEYEFYSSWGRVFGLAFGAEQGVFPLSLDNDNSNDTGVAIYMENNGTMYVYGAIDSTNAVATAGVTVTKNVTNTQYYGNVVGTANVKAEGMTGGDTIEVEGTLTEESPVFTMCVKVENSVLTIYEKNHADYVVTIPLSGNYQGGYVSLIANETNHGAFGDFLIKKLEASTNPPEPVTNPMDEVAEQFDAYYLADASVTNVMESVDVKEHWGINGQGFISAAKDSTGNETRNVDVLTWKEKPYTDFEMTFTYQQTWHRVGVLLGTEKGVYPLSKSGDSTIAEGGVMFFLEAEGTPNAMGDFVNGYTNAQNVHRRITGLNLANFTDETGNATTHVNNKTEHTLKIVVKDKDLYAYVDSYTDPVMYLALPDDYEGGYVSLFSASNPGYGVKDFAISEEITTALPEKETGDNVYEVDFTELHGIKELAEDFSAYALDSIEEEPREIPVEEAFTIVGNGIRRNTESQGNDWGGFHILTLNNKRYENFELELVYAQSWIRFGVMVGEPGEFAYSGTEGDCRGTYGAALAYTEAEGHRNIKGGMTAGSTTVHSYALTKDETRIPGFDDLGSVEKNVNGEVLHTMKLRVVGDYLTMVIDGNEDSRLTVCLDGYDGGYISLVTNGSATAKGAFRSLKITELGADAALGTKEPEQKNGFTSLEKMEEEFDAYYLADAAVSTAMEPVDLVENWWFNAQGYAARYEAGHGSEYEDVDVLTYTKQTYTDFELTYTYQQTYNRTGIIIGTQAGQFPLQATDQGLKATGGVMFFMEAEGNPNAMGDFVSGYTNQGESRQRLGPVEMGGFVDAEGSAMDNVNNKASHQVKIVVKNREMYVFVDGSSDYCMYLKLPESYNGGYISIFSSAPKAFGIDSFTVSENITTALPAKTGVSSDGTSMSVSFANQNFDAGAFDTYYMEKIDEAGSMAQTDFYDYWMIANGSLKRQSNSVGGSDVSDVAVLTYKERTYEDFVATIEYQKTPGRLMFFFGTENGSYPLYRDDAGDQENGGVILYPENDMGAGGGICAVGEVKLANAGYRPIYYVKPYAPGYHDQEEWLSNVGNTYTMTVAVINKHCYVYLEGFGLMTDFDLMDDYDGGYLSLASSSTAQHGFKSFSVTALDGSDGGIITDAADLRDITVRTGTSLEALELPSTVRVTTGNGQRFDADVTWSAQGYDGSTPGNYQFVGTLSVPGLSNPGRVAALLTVRVRDSWQSSSGSTKIWTFDTESDLLDFESYYVKDANEGGAVWSDFPMWYVQDGQLWMDRNRGSNGSENSNLHILTYTGKQYKNFEAQVDFSQQYVRQMILFGSKEPGQYIDYADPHAATNPIAAYVEFEGNRNAIGNVVNTNYYRRMDEQVPMLREDAAVDDQFYDKENPQNSMGTMHTLKIRVVGDEISMWLDDYEEVFTGKIGEGYEGGYISLVSAAREVALDNFRITELDEDGNPVEENLTVAANGTLNLTLGEDVPEQVQEVEPTKPAEEEEPKKEVPVVGIVAGVCAAVVVTAGIITIVILRKKRKNAEKPEETDRKEGN